MAIGSQYLIISQAVAKTSTLINAIPSFKTQAYLYAKTRNESSEAVLGADGVE